MKRGESVMGPEQGLLIAEAHYPLRPIASFHKYGTRQ